MSSDPSAHQTTTTIRLPDEQTYQTIKYRNLDQVIIEISEDKVKLYLNQHMKRIKSKFDWIGPFGILVTILITEGTANFHKYMGITPAMWSQIFTVIAIISALLCIRSAYITVKAHTSDSIDAITRDILVDMKTPQSLPPPR